MASLSEMLQYALVKQQKQNEANIPRRAMEGFANSLTKNFDESFSGDRQKKIAEAQKAQLELKKEQYSATMRDVVMNNLKRSNPELFPVDDQDMKIARVTANDYLGTSGSNPNDNKKTNVGKIASIVDGYKVKLGGDIMTGDITAKLDSAKPTDILRVRKIAADMAKRAYVEKNKGAGLVRDPMSGLLVDPTAQYMPSEAEIAKYYPVAESYISGDYNAGKNFMEQEATAGTGYDMTQQDISALEDELLKA